MTNITALLITNLQGNVLFSRYFPDFYTTEEDTERATFKFEADLYQLSHDFWTAQGKQYVFIGEFNVVFLHVNGLVLFIVGRGDELGCMLLIFWLCV